MKHFTLGAACASLLIAVSGAAQAVAISGQGTWESTLQGRDLDGDLSTFEAYYDTVLDITWLADANYAGIEMDWATADTWAASLDPYDSGITGWRLPTVTDVTPDCSSAESNYNGTNCGYNASPASSEMAHLFYATLGDLATFDTNGNWQIVFDVNTGPFSNVQFNSGSYWSATFFGPPNYVWGFEFSSGGQWGHSKESLLYVWAVHEGDIGASAVPVPAAAWLFGSGLLGLVGVSRKRRR